RNDDLFLDPRRAVPGGASGRGQNRQKSQQNEVDGGCDHAGTLRIEETTRPAKGFAPHGAPKDGWIEWRTPAVGAGGGNREIESSVDGRVRGRDRRSSVRRRRDVDAAAGPAARAGARENGVEARSRPARRPDRRPDGGDRLAR